MSDAKPQQEPSMEEILASIRRIISEDSDSAKGGTNGSAAPAPVPAAAAPAAQPEPLDFGHMELDADILDLTQRADPMAEAPPPPAAHAEPEPLFEFQEEPEPEPDIDADEMNVPEVDFSDGLMSRASANAAEDAFSRLSAMNMDPAPMMAPAPMVTSASVDQVLERLVKDALKPVLKEWLDMHLPPMVEELVRQEIQRLAQAGKRR
jgi:cell pole-organizing protein PopZ